MTGSIRNFEKLNFIPKLSVFCFSQGQTSKSDRLAHTVKQCFDIDRKINVRKPLRPCTVPAWAIIDGQSVIVPHLTFVINTCLDENIFPIELKKAHVRNLFV